MDAVNVNSVHLIIAGSAIVGAVITAVSLCSKSSPASSLSLNPKKPPTKVSGSAQKQKKKQKLSKKKSDNNEKKNGINTKSDDAEEEENSDSIQEIKTVVKFEDPKVYESTIVEGSINQIAKEIEGANQLSSDTEEKLKKAKKSKETSEQKAARIERQKVVKLSKSDDASKTDEKKGSTSSVLDNILDLNLQSSSSGPTEGWAVVEERKKPIKKASITTPEPKVETSTPSTAAVMTAVAADVVQAEIKVDGKKIGAIIGPKGANLRSLLELTGTIINIPKDRETKTALISLTGPAEGVAAATKAINDICAKGYSPLLEGENFSEGHVSVHPSFIPDIIGKGGAVRKALQDYTNVRINIPPNTTRDQTTNVKILLAGQREKVSQCKKLIKEITQFYHTEVSHPGMVHEEMDIASTMYNVIIGKHGSEIKHIQNSFKVNVHIPGAHSSCPHVLVLGEPANVASAVRYINKKLEQIEARNNAVETAPSVSIGTGVAVGADDDEEAHEDWMDEFTHPSKRKNKPSASGATGSDSMDIGYSLADAMSSSGAGTNSFPSVSNTTNSAVLISAPGPKGAWSTNGMTPEVM